MNLEDWRQERSSLRGDLKQAKEDALTAKRLFIQELADSMTETLRLSKLLDETNKPKS